MRKNFDSFLCRCFRDHSGIECSERSEGIALLGTQSVGNLSWSPLFACSVCNLVNRARLFQSSQNAQSAWPDHGASDKPTVCIVFLSAPHNFGNRMAF